MTPKDPAEGMLPHFSFAHLPEHLQEASAPFFRLASDLVRTLPIGPEKTVCMRKLLEAKDCAVRAAIHSTREG